MRNWNCEQEAFLDGIRAESLFRFCVEFRTVLAAKTSRFGEVRAVCFKLESNNFPQQSNRRQFSVHTKKNSGDEPELLEYDFKNYF